MKVTLAKTRRPVAVVRVGGVSTARLEIFHAQTSRSFSSLINQAPLVLLLARTLYFSSPRDP